jgi:ABC-type transport system involved in multi-copper enzyme maturation permease subunit
MLLFPYLAPNRIGATLSAWHVAVATVVNGLILWCAFWLFAPDLLVGSTAGMQTLAEAIPALIVALFIFVLGAVFAVAQVTINSYGQRGVLVLVEDVLFVTPVVRLLVLAVAALLLGALIPDDTPAPAPWLTAGFSAAAC